MMKHRGKTVKFALVCALLSSNLVRDISSEISGSTTPEADTRADNPLVNFFESIKSDKEFKNKLFPIDGDTTKLQHAPTTASLEPGKSTGLHTNLPTETPSSAGAEPREIVPSNKANTTLIILVTVPSLIGVVIFGLISRAAYKHRLKKSKKSEKIPGKPELSDILLAMLDADKKWKLQKLLVARNRLDIQGELGQGAFGIVYKGRYNPDNNPLKIQIVAVKTLKERCIGSQIAGLVDEAIMMAEFKHTHVLSIIGVCMRAEDGIPLLMLPYMEHGDLKTYLRKFVFEDSAEQPAEETQLLLFCLQIARGMEYLAEQKFIHRDLAARNCMLDSNLVVKVADFGLTRDIYTSSYYTQDQQKLLPLKWMALESLQFRRFTTETDIWSFGVTMWEVLSLGMVPYPELDNVDVHKYLRGGTRLEQPEYCNDQMYSLMYTCWKEKPEARPTFPDISAIISAYLAEMTGYLDMDEMKHYDMEEDKVEEARYAGFATLLSSQINKSPVQHGIDHDLERVDVDMSAAPLKLLNDSTVIQPLDSTQIQIEIQDNDVRAVQ